MALPKSRKQLRSALEEAQGHNLQIAEAFEHTQSELALVQRRLDDVYYLNLNAFPSRDDYAILPAAKKRDVIRRLRILRQENPLAKQAMKLAQRFTFGKGITYVIKNKESSRIINQFWADPVNQSVLTSRQSMRDRFDETLTDGEKFTVMFKGESPPYVRLGEIPMEEIVDIIPHPENRFVPVYYKRRFFKMIYDASAHNGDGEWKRVGVGGSKNKPFTEYYRDYRVTDEMLDEIGSGLQVPDSLIVQDAYVRHRLVNPIWTKDMGRRGVSELFASREWFRVFKEFMEDRGSINAAANTFSYVRKIKGGQAAVASVKGKIGQLDVGFDDPSLLRRMTRPVSGAIYDINDAMDIAALRADTGAVDAKEDARMLLMTGGAGVGTMLPYFGEGGDANLATAQAMELPMVKAYEDYQTEVKEELNAICMFVLETHYGETAAEAAGKDTGAEEVPSPVAMVAGEAVEELEPPQDELEEPDDEELASADPDDGIDDRFIISWQMPPIISHDVVKYITAWSQLGQQIAPGNRIVKRAVIRGALTTMDVPNVESMMTMIDAEEIRLEREKKLQQEQMKQNMLQNGLNGAQNGENGAQNGANGKKIGGAPDPLGPDLKRLVDGKRPRVPATGGRLRNRQVGG